MKNKIEISGPYFAYSSPFGKALENLNRDEWFVSRKLTEQELNDSKTSEISKILKEVCLGQITKFRNQKRRYIIDQLYPIIDFTSLNKAVNFLVKNEGKLVFCS